jgi:hypothetical protein
MISDYSGIIFDFVFLFKKPVLFSNAHFDPEMYDASDLDHEPWKFTVVREFGFELKDSDIPLIREKIEAALEDRRLLDVMEKARDTAWQHIGESGEKVADFMIAKQKTLSGQLWGNYLYRRGHALTENTVSRKVNGKYKRKYKNALTRQNQQVPE